MTRRNKLFWIGVLYFAEGLPFGIAYDVWPVYFRVHGVSLREIGLMSLLSLPWTWKVLWAPLVDRFGSRQVWVVPALGAMAAISLAVPALDPAHPSTALWILLLLFTTASATQDIAIDAYAVDVAEGGDRGEINGVRVSAARVALLVGGGGAIALAGLIGWNAIWIALSILFAVLAIASSASPRVALNTQQRKSLRPMLAWLLRWQMLPVAALVLLYKLGDSTLGRMVKPFWVDRGYSEIEIGTISISLGVALTIVGALVGGWFTDRVGVIRSLLWLGVAQLVSNLGYVAVATFELPRESIYVASVVESFTQGLGTAAFLSFLMSLCDKEHAATQYALLSALFAFTRDVAGAFTGIGVERLGYARFFGLTTALAVPGLLLIPLVRGFVNARLGDTDERDEKR